MAAINVFEYSKSDELISKNAEEIHNYFQNSNYFRKGKNKNKVFAVVEYDKKLRNQGPWVGIVTIYDQIFNFKSKLDKQEVVSETNFFYMLSYLNDLDSFYFDPKNYSLIKEGSWFFDIIGKVFEEQFKEVFKKSLLKKYVRKEEKINFLKGKLLIKKQAKQIVQNKFCCEYDDLTHDNLENQAILFCAYLLADLVKNQKLKTNLRKVINILQDEITLNKNLNKEDLKKIKFNRLNNYYERIIETSKYVINKTFVSKIHEEENFTCCNFLVDMNKVYENFVTAMFEKILENDTEYILLAQLSNKSLVKSGKKFTTKPDLMIALKENKEEPIIFLDIKYKNKDVKSSDFYQMCSYSLAYPKIKHAFLLYENLENETENKSVVLRENNEENKIEIHYIKLQLKEILKEEQNKDEFEEKIQNKLKTLIKDILIKYEV